MCVSWMRWTVSLLALWSLRLLCCNHQSAGYQRYAVYVCMCHGWGKRSPYWLCGHSVCYVVITSQLVTSGMQFICVCVCHGCLFCCCFVCLCSHYSHLSVGYGRSTVFVCMCQGGGGRAHYWLYGRSVCLCARNRYQAAGYWFRTIDMCVHMRDEAESLTLCFVVVQSACVHIVVTRPLVTGGGQWHMVFLLMMLALLVSLLAVIAFLFFKYSNRLRIALRMTPPGAKSNSYKSSPGRRKFIVTTVCAGLYNDI